MHLTTQVSYPADPKTEIGLGRISLSDPSQRLAIDRIRNARYTFSQKGISHPTAKTSLPEWTGWTVWLFYELLDRLPIRAPWLDAVNELLQNAICFPPITLRQYRQILSRFARATWTPEMQCPGFGQSTHRQAGLLYSDITALFIQSVFGGELQTWDLRPSDPLSVQNRFTSPPWNDGPRPCSIDFTQYKEVNWRPPDAPGSSVVLSGDDFRAWCHTQDIRLETRFALFQVRFLETTAAFALACTDKNLP